jgi:p-hydroxybenzoate 3-monooxygenase
MTDSAALKTQVVIVGGGPAGLLLSQILDLQGVESVVIEQRSKDYVMARIRAGVVEHGSAQILRDADVGTRMDAEGYVHDGTVFAVNREPIRIDFKELTDGKSVMVYGQTEITKDLYDARERRGGVVLDEAERLEIHGISTDSPFVTFIRHGQPHTVSGRFIAGCDGYHGASRQSVRTDALRTFELIYPFGWLGILSETPPCHEELIYANHPDGFALCSMRNPMLSRYYVQCKTDERVEDWSDDRFWDTLRQRLPQDVSDALVTGPSIEKSLTPLRSFVAEPMRFDNLFLAGDAAHIVPPTGAKGLNLAISDVTYLSRAFVEYFGSGSTNGIDHYSDRALARVWKAVRFSWSMTTLLHRFPDDPDIRPKLQIAELEYLKTSRAAQQSFAENYVGLPI